MRRSISPFAVAGALALGAVPYGAQTAPPGFGPDPKLPAPAKSLLPTVNIAQRRTAGPPARPHSGCGPRRSQRSPTGLDHPRWLYVLPNGDVLVAETNGPAPRRRPASRTG